MLSVIKWSVVMMSVVAPFSPLSLLPSPSCFLSMKVKGGEENEASLIFLFFHQWHNGVKLSAPAVYDCL